MSELKKIQQNYSTYRRDIAGINASLQKAKVELENLNSREKEEFKTLDVQTRDARKAFYEEQRKGLSTKFKRLLSERKSLNELLGNLSLDFQHDPIEKIKELNDAFPILMFPLRLEVRFKSKDDQPQLWLRVYPDDCNINKKEDLLSESEFINAKSFWIEIWKAGGIENEERGAWKRLVNSQGSGRAAWIIEQYKPNNIKPSKPDSDYKILVVIPTLVLSDDEHKAARDYWVSVWLSKGNNELLNESLNSLKSSVGNAKAYEIIQKYIPENINDDVPAGIENQLILLEKLELPSKEEYITTQTSWTKAPKAIALPDRFVAVAYTGINKRVILFDKPVEENLLVGPDPTLPSDEQIKKDADGNLIINEDLRWMVDFEKAIQVGMGTKINLTPQEAANGFDKLFVVGFRFSSDEIDSKEQLEKLLTDHFFSKDGFGLLKQGTPTNNTEDEPSGYSWIDDPYESYDRIFKRTEDFEEKFDFTKISDGQKLADCLGIDPEILKKIPNANGRDQLEAYALNTALFPATMGYFMEEMMHPLFSDSDIYSTKILFSNFVSGRGPIPAIRIGKQPYGILPISVYSKLKFLENTNLTEHFHFGKTFLSRLHSLLLKINTSWDDLLNEVSYIGKNGEDVDPHQILLDVIGLHPNSVEFHQRYAQSIQLLYNKLNLQANHSYAKKVADGFLEKASNLLRELKIDQRLPILEKYFLSKPNLLSGPLIDDVPLSELNPIRYYSNDEKNYIEWLASSDAENIRTENFGEGKKSPNALLYLFLRHALMLSQADAATQLLVKNNLVANKRIFHDPDFIHIQKEEAGKSKFEHLYNTNPAITGSNDLRLIEHLYKPDVLHQLIETKNLRETLDALKILEKTPTARLERLLVEHLDCCNYRIDSWKTGLVNFRLTEQRRINQESNKLSKGLYLGAYGWLIDVKPENKVLTEVNLSSELNEIFNKETNSPLQTDSKNLGYIHAPSLNQAAAAAILRNAYDSNRNSGSGNPFAINLTSDRVRIANIFLEGIRNGQSLSALLGYQFERGLHDKYNLGQGEVDKFIYPLRKIFSLVAESLVDTKLTSEEMTEVIQSKQNIEANNVIDGLKLINHIQKADDDKKTYPFGFVNELPPADNNQIKAITNEVKRIMGIHDAISDLVIAEQVYQVVQGNFERASGNAEAFSKGSYPPDIDIVNTPRSGVTLTERMAIHFDAEASSAFSPNSIPLTPRAKAEPSINKWLSTIFPKPEDVLCKVTYSSPKETDIKILVSQKDLSLQPIDLLYCFNFDTEQAMTELDDRISNYIRYSKSKHPKTAITINYTEQVDKDDKTKISFFELAALVKSVRKILIGSKFLTCSAVTLPTIGEQQTFSINDAQLKTRVTGLKDSLAPIKSTIESILLSTKSIAKLTEDFKTKLAPHITDIGKLETLINQFELDLKDYLTNYSNDNKDKILSAFETNIPSIVDPSDVANLKTEYETHLNEYLTDFSNFDKLSKDTSIEFLNLALFDNNQTGIGFIQQGISGVYDSVFFKLDKVIERWENKTNEFNTLILEYDPIGLEEEQFDLLKKAERIISSQSTFPLEGYTLDDYKDIVDDKKTSFDSLLENLNNLRKNDKDKITKFIVDAETHIKNISNFDVISFDIENNRNDLKAEKLKIVLLKEDIKVALDNVNNTIANKINLAEEQITASDETVINNDKIKAILIAAKKILGEEALILPHFNLGVSQANEFENTYVNSESLLKFIKQDINEEERKIFPVEDWLSGLSRVRVKVNYWENITFLSEAFTSNSLLDLKPLQFPYQDVDRWLALKFIDEKNPFDKFQISNDTLLYTAHFANDFDKAKPQCGIIIDEWTEVIPSNEETTGIAFHYDQPNSEPPQTMLLVTPPEFSGNWKWDDIIESMEETLEMAKKRAIEPSQIERTNYAQFLPTTMMAVTLYWITIATNLAINNNVYQKIEIN